MDGGGGFGGIFAGLTEDLAPAAPSGRPSTAGARPSSATPKRPPSPGPKRPSSAAASVVSPSGTGDVDDDGEDAASPAPSSFRSLRRLPSTSRSDVFKDLRSEQLHNAQMEFATVLTDFASGVVGHNDLASALYRALDIAREAMLCDLAVISPQPAAGDALREPLISGGSSLRSGAAEALVAVAGLSSAPHVVQALESLAPVAMDDATAVDASPAPGVSIVASFNVAFVKSLLCVPVVCGPERSVAALVTFFSVAKRSWHQLEVQFGEHFGRLAAPCYVRVVLEKENSIRRARRASLSAGSAHKEPESPGSEGASKKRDRDVMESAPGLELRRAKAAAEKASSAKSAFLAHMSHEMRTPLTAILAVSSLLLEKKDRFTNEEADFLSTILHSGEQLLAFVTNVLEFSRIEAGHLELDPVKFDLRESLDSVLSMIAPKCHRDVDCVYILGADVPCELRGDETRLRQVLLNFLSNGLKFSEQGEVVLRVQTVRSDVATVELHFSIKDDGVGIPAESIPDLFQSFSQVDTSRSRRLGGTGLGLALCKLLVEKMGGKVWCESQVGLGSTFHFTILLEHARAPYSAIFGEERPQTARSQPAATPHSPRSFRSAVRPALRESGPGSILIATREKTSDEEGEAPRAGKRSKTDSDEMADDPPARSPAPAPPAAPPRYSGGPLPPTAPGRGPAPPPASSRHLAFQGRRATTPEAPAAEKKSSAPALSPADAAALRGKRLLVVDDSRATLEAIQSALRPLEMEVACASTAEEVARREGEPWDFIFVDRHIESDNDGFAVAKRLAETAAQRIVAAAFASATADAATAAVAAALPPWIVLMSNPGDKGLLESLPPDSPVGAVMLKPVTFNKLMNAMRSCARRGSASVPAAADSSVDGLLGAQHPLRILIAEDNLVNQKVAKKILQSLGFATADVANNGAEAVDLCKTQKYDIVFMDLRMPIMDGLEATRVLQTLGEKKPEYVVACTADVVAGVKEQCFEAGMAAYLPKPFRKFDVTRVLEDYIVAKMGAADVLTIS